MQTANVENGHECAVVLFEIGNALYCLPEEYPQLNRTSLHFTLCSHREPGDRVPVVQSGDDFFDPMYIYTHVELQSRQQRTFLTRQAIEKRAIQQTASTMYDAMSPEARDELGRGYVSPCHQRRLFLSTFCTYVVYVSV